MINKFKFRRMACALAMLPALAGATVTSSTVGNTTVYHESFDVHGTSLTLSGGAIVFDALFSTDDYLVVAGPAAQVSLTVSVPHPLLAATVSFWYAALSQGAGVAEVNGRVFGVAPAGTDPVSFEALNPGPGGSGDDRYAEYTWTDVAPGDYTLTFRTSGQMLDAFKLDELTITLVSRVPEPAGLALLLASLGAAGAMSRRRKPSA
jgi:hypothetical protein